MPATKKTKAEATAKKTTKKKEEVAKVKTKVAKTAKKTELKKVVESFITNKIKSVALLEYLICSKFGWTLEEVRNMPESDLDIFVKIMNLEAKFSERESNKNMIPNKFHQKLKYTPKYAKRRR